MRRTSLAGSVPAPHPTHQRELSRVTWSISAVLIALLVPVAGCSGDGASDETLPPIQTTTTSTPLSANASRFYQVKSGDTLTMIARSHRTTVDAIMERNAIANPDDIRVGQVLELPLPAAPPTTAGTATTSTAP